MKKALTFLLVSGIFITSGCVADQPGAQVNDASNTVSSTATTQVPETAASTKEIETMVSSEQNQESQTLQSTEEFNTLPPESMLPKLEQPKKGDTIAIMETDFGTIKIRLFTKDVPTLTKNFMELAKAGKYDGTPFHRVVKDFMIQGGDFTQHNGTGGYSYKGPNQYLANEISPKHKQHLYGTLSMAKTGAPVSIGSQFFIVTNRDGTPFLDGGYSPFGQVYEGMDVAEKIQNLQVPGTEEPGQQVLVKKVTISTFKK